MERERDLSKHEAVVGYLKQKSLTRRELTLLRLAAVGLLHKEIAEKLGLKSPSVEYAFHCMFNKLGVRNKHEAVILAINSAWINPIGYVGDSDLSLFETLTPRQIDVVKLHATGKTNQETADGLVIEKKTVENHNNSIYSHLGILNGEHAHKKARLTVLYYAYLESLRK